MARERGKIGSANEALPMMLAVDAGATHTRAVIADITGKVAGKGLAGPGNSYAVGPIHSLENLGKATTQALRKSGIRRSQVSVVVIGSASVDYDGSGAAPIARIIKRHLPVARTLVKADALIAVEGALAGEAGVVIVCGTGSIVLGKDSRGNIVKVGGWGPLMGDEGSAQWVGREALRRAALAADRTGPPTVLIQCLLKQYKLRSFDRIIDAVYKRHMTPAELGMLAPMVSSAAKEGDEVARDIFHAGAEALASQAARAATRLKLRHARISYQGSMFNTGPLLLDPLRTRLRRLAPQAKLMAPAFSPLAGAFLLALRAKNVEAFESALHKFQRGCDA
jgi:glucosamine kinase